MKVSEHQRYAPAPVHLPPVHRPGLTAAVDLVRVVVARCPAHHVQRPRFQQHADNGLVLAAVGTGTAPRCRYFRAIPQVHDCRAQEGNRRKNVARELNAVDMGQNRSLLGDVKNMDLRT